MNIMHMDRHRLLTKFLKYMVFFGLIFFFAICIGVGTRLVLGDSFVQAWRWFHDQLLINVFWYTSPFFIAIVILLAAKPSWTHWVPQWLHNIILASFILTFSSVFSQSFGGCIWFWPTEKWWARFELFGLGDTVSTLIYSSGSVFLVWLIWYYWTRYVFPTFK